MNMADEHLGDEEAGPTWHDLLGKNSWDGLLNPLNYDLRRLILRCGDLCQVTYDTFINDPNSEYCGSSRYAKADLLDKTAFPGGGARYDVVGFLYATAEVSTAKALFIKSRSREMWDKESNWIGYVLVTNDEASAEIGRREIYVAWRGTTRDYEWVDVLEPSLKSAEPLLVFEPGSGKEEIEHEAKDQKEAASSLPGDTAVPDSKWAKIGLSVKNTVSQCLPPCFNPGQENEDGSNDDKDDNEIPKVMKGWLVVYLTEDPKSSFTKLSARTQLLTKLKHLLDQYKDENPSITFAGHSLGATLSVVSAFDVCQNLTTEVPVTAIVFGCPKVGNKVFKEKFESFPNLKVLHVRNVIDLIPHYPTRLSGYVNIGTELEIDTRKSTYLKGSKNPSDWHNLQAMLHIVNGWQGMKNEFELKIKRSIALVNKSCDFLKEECLVPPSWWVEKNKGMVLNEDGDWVLAGPEESPVPEFD